MGNGWEKRGLPKNDFKVILLGIDWPYGDIA